MPSGASSASLLGIALSLVLCGPTSLNEYKIGPGDTDNQVLALGASSAWDDGRINSPLVVVDGGTVYLFYTGSTVAGLDYQIGVASVSATGFTGKGFTKYGSNPILSPGGVGTWDHAFVGGATVIHDPDDGIWKMWYSGQDAVPGTQKIGYATASSPLGPWTKHGSNPILSPSAGWEGSIVSVASVTKLGPNNYVMLYCGDEPASVNGRTGLATSTDGINWTKYGSNPVISPDATRPWTAASPFSARNLEYDGTTYSIWLTAKQQYDRESRIGRATSPDLHSWTPSDGAFITASRAWESANKPSTWEAGEVESPFVIDIGNYRYIYYDVWFGTPSVPGVIRIPIA